MKGDIERAFAAEKLKQVKREIAANECGVVYPATFDFYVAEHPYWIDVTRRMQFWGVYIPSPTARRKRRVKAPAA